MSIIPIKSLPELSPSDQQALALHWASRTPYEDIRTVFRRKGLELSQKVWDSFTEHFSTIYSVG